MKSQYISYGINILITVLGIGATTMAIGLDRILPDVSGYWFLIPGIIMIIYGITGVVGTLIGGETFARKFLTFKWYPSLDAEHMQVLGTILKYKDALFGGNIEKYERINSESIAKAGGISKMRSNEIIQNLKKKRLILINNYGDVADISKKAKKYLLKRGF